MSDHWVEAAATAIREFGIVSKDGDVATPTYLARLALAPVQAELDRLRAELQGHVTACSEYARENVSLRAENAELKEWAMSLNAKECDRLRAENAALRQQLMDQGLATTNDSLEATHDKADKP